jgi:hypothetical protein
MTVESEPFTEEMGEPGKVIEKKVSDKDLKKETVKKNPSNMLTKFFKPLDPEEKQKILLNELAKV